MISSIAVAPSAPRMGRREYGLITLQSMLWGSAFFFVTVVGDELPPLTMTALRLVPATLMLFVIIAALGMRLPATRDAWVRMLLMAAFNNVIPFVLIIQAQREVSGGIAAIFNATAPLFAVFIASLFVPEEKLVWRRVLGIVAGVLGVAILVGGPGATVSAHAAALLLSAACCYAGANVMTRLFFPTYPPFVIAAAQMLASLMLAAPAAVLFERPWSLPLPSTTAMLAVLGMGVLSSALASLCHFTVLRRAGPTNGMLVTIILPLTPIVLGALVFGEHVTLRQIGGGLVIATALLIIDGRLWTRLVQPWRPTVRS